MKRRKKNSKQKRVLVTSILLAMLIVAGGTFAWFTSKDEVTNKLTASNSFGVSITESFTPPSQWLPGQTIEKKVSVVNTGNIDAFVKVALSDSMKVTTITGESTAPTSDNISSTAYVELTGPSTDATNTPDEVTALQAGGILVYAAGNTINDENVGTGFTPRDLLADNNGITSSMATNATGLYIFKRTTSTTTDTTTNATVTNEYAGYYFLQGTSTTDDKYYALESITGPTTDGNTTFTATYQKKETTDVTQDSLTWELTNGGQTIKVTYEGTDKSSSNKAADDIIININLAEAYTSGSGDVLAGTNWTLDKSAWTFYYNKLLAAGDTSKLIVESVELDESVTADAYADLEYNLTVASDSVQVTLDKDKNQTATAVPTTGWLTPTPASSSTTPTTIDSIAWSKASQ